MSNTNKNPVKKYEERKIILHYNLLQYRDQLTGISDRNKAIVKNM